MSMQVRLLYFPDCPGWEQTGQHLDEVLEELGLGTTPERIDVTQRPTLPDAFYGSPTVNYRNHASEEWQDLFGRSGKSEMACKIYRHDGQIKPYIPKDILKAQLQQIIQEQKG